MRTSSPPLADAKFTTHFHACAFVTGPEEERDVIDPFVVQLMKRGEKAVYIVDPLKREETDARLRPSAPSNDVLDVTTWNEAHLKGGSFDPDRMLRTLEEMIQEHAATGRPTMHLIGQMGWILSNPPGIEKLVEYEATVNDLLSRGKTPTICIYDVRRLNGGILMDLLRAHPLTVVNGVLHENPFYTPPEEMLREMRLRRTAS